MATSTTFNDAVLSEILLAPNVDAQLRAAWGDIAAAIPELGALAMPDGAGRHKDNVEHTIKVTAKTPARLRVRLTGLFHDVGKPPTRVITDSGVTFHHHERRGAAIAKKVLVRLGYSEQLADEVARLVEISGSTKGSQDWTDSAVRRFALDAGSLLEDLFDFANVDVTSRYEANHDRVREEVATLRRRVAEVAAADEAAKWRPVLSGDDLMFRYNMRPGKDVGFLLRKLAELQRSAEASGVRFGPEEAWIALDEYRDGEE